MTHAEHTRLTHIVATADMDSDEYREAERKLSDYNATRDSMADRVDCARMLEIRVN